jgi:hypothetical protein
MFKICLFKQTRQIADMRFNRIKRPVFIIIGQADAINNRAERLFKNSRIITRRRIKIFATSYIESFE